MENIFMDRQELSCYSFEEKPTIQQINIIELEKIIINQDLKTADFIEAEISGYDIQIDASDVISANSITILHELVRFVRISDSPA